MKNEEESLRKLAEQYIAIKPKMKKALDEKLKEIIDYQVNKTEIKLRENYQLYYFLEKYRGKLLVRGFLVAATFDWRKKNPVKSTYIQEIYRAYEGLDSAVSRGVYVTTSTWSYGKTLHYYEVPDYTLFSQNYYATYYNGAWKKTKIEAYDEFSHKMYTASDMLELKPELKYSQFDVEKDHPISFAAKYQKYPEIEMLRKLGMKKYESSTMVLKKLQSKDAKRFKKLLFNLSKTERYKNEYQQLGPKDLISYFNKYGIDAIAIDTYLTRKEITERIMETIDNRYYNNFKGVFKREDIEPVIKMVLKAHGDWGYYNDYLRMAKAVGHDIKDPYWKIPYDLKKFHDKVFAENKAIKAAKNKDKEVKMGMLLGDMLKFNTEIDGYQIFIPTDYAEISKQCDVLYQCLLRCHYDEKVLKQDIILVFIRKEGVPIATAEVFYNKKVGQFYADEHDHNNCTPTKEVNDVFYKWLETFKPKKANLEKVNKQFIAIMQAKQRGGINAAV